MFELAILIVGAFVSLLLAMLVLVKNPRSVTNRTFAALALIFVLEPILNYLSLHTTEHLLFIRLTMVAVVGLSLAFRWLTAWFPSHTIKFRRLRFLELLGALVAALAVASPIGFTSVSVAANGNISPHPGSGMALFLAFFVYAVVSGIFNLLQRLGRFHGAERAQIQYLFVASILLFGLAIISSLILPLVFDFSGTVALTPIYFVIFNTLIAIAIVRQRLFDIRAVVARSLAYTLLLGSLVVIYALLIFGLSALLLHGEKVSGKYQMSNVAIAVILAFTFPFLKRFFDRLTNRLFFREAYDSQEVIKVLSEMLVSQVTLEAIMRRSLQILLDNLKLSHALFLVLDGETLYRTEACGNPPRPYPQLAILRRLHTDLVNVNDLSGEPKNQLLDEYDVSFCIRLHTREAVVGYLLLGSKKSGNSYSVQDVELLQITSRQLAVATQNALHYEKISRFNVELQSRVTQATHRLRANNQKLRTLDETKDDFISMASHQLRTPLTSVKGYLSLVLEGDAGRLNPQQRKLLTQSFASSQRMVYLISDLLNVSRLRTGKFIIDAQPVNLADIITDEIAQLQETAATRTLVLTYDKPKDFPRLMLDETKTRQVIMNFIDNAIYYTPAGGHIRVELLNKPSTVELRVVDDGMGVPRSEQHHLFTKFYRAGNARKARPDGTGLGLFMAKKVIAAQGGAIIFESQENKGSTFGFSFSKAKLAAPDANEPKT